MSIAPVTTCKYHPNEPAVHRCSRCGAPICKTCHDMYPDERLCPKCFRDVVAEEANEALTIRQKVKKELKFIYAGLIIGAIIALLVCIPMLIGGAEFSDWASFLLVPFWFGSLLTIIKTIKRIWTDEEGDSQSSGFMELILSALVLFVAPIITIWRIVIRKKDERYCEQIYAQDIEGLEILDNFLANFAQSAAHAAAYLSSLATGGAGDQEISLTAILTSKYGSDTALCGNGEILRQIDKR